MAITATASTGFIGEQNADTFQNITVAGADILPGDLIVVGIACDNAGASGASSISGVIDSQAHTYSQVKLQNRTAGSAVSDGCTAAIYVARCTAKLSQGTNLITVQFTTATTAKVLAYQAFRGVEDIAYSTNGVGGTGTTYNSAATATASMADGDLVVVVVASESGNTLPTTDTDTTKGSWVSAQRQQSGGAGADATKMSINLQYKITSGGGSGTQTASAACASSDWAVAWGLFTVPVTKSDTETGAQVDTESVNTGAQPSDSDTGAGVDTESVNTGAQPSDNDPGTAVDAGESLAVAVAPTASGYAAYAAGGKFGKAGGTVALSGVGGAGGAASASIGVDATHSGGTGGQGFIVNGNGGGGGGGQGAGATGDGNNGGNSTGDAGGTGGVGAPGLLGGGLGVTGSTGSGTNGDVAGGGGGGGVTSVSASAQTLGGPGRVTLTYNDGATTTRTVDGTLTSGAAVVTGADFPPSGATQVVIECWGGGGCGGGGNAGVGGGGGGGGGGGAYAKTTLSLTGVALVRYSVASRTASGNVDGAPTFAIAVPDAAVDSAVATEGDPTIALFMPAAALCLARGGGGATNTVPGAGGLASASIGDTLFSGGDGFAGTTAAGDVDGGGGGSSAGTAANGTSATGRPGGVAPSGGGDGGGGGVAATPTGPVAGVTPGGGGGGGYAKAGAASGGNVGGQGKVVITYDDAGPTVRTYTATPSGSTTVADVAPGGVTQAVIECWGGGGGGSGGLTNTQSGAGGGGGAYAKRTVGVTSGVLFRGQAGSRGSPTLAAVDSFVTLASVGDSGAGVDGGENVDTGGGGSTPISDADAGSATTTPYFEPFTHADAADWNGLALTWGVMGGSALAIVSNQGAGTGVSSSMRAEHDQASADHEVSMDITALPNVADTTSIPSALVRCAAAADTCYLLERHANTTDASSYFGFSKRVAGVRTALSGVIAVPWTGPERITFSVVGTTLTAYRNGAQIAQMTDGSITTGVRGGIRISGANSSGARLDNFAVGPVGTTNESETSAVASGVTDNEPASAADAGESIADTTTDADTGTESDAEVVAIPITDADVGAFSDAGGYATPTQVQKVAAANTTGASITGTFASTPTPGNVLISSFATQAAGVGVTVTPPSGWTLLQTLDSGFAGNERWGGLAYKVVGVSELTSWTWTQNGASANLDAIAVEYSGLDVASLIDQQSTMAQQSNNGNIPGVTDTLTVGPTGTTTRAVELAVAALVIANRSGQAFDNGFTLENAQVSRTMFGTKVLAATGTVTTTATWTPGNDSAGVIVTFRAAPGSGGESIAAAVTDPESGSAVDTESAGTTITDPDTGATVDIGAIAAGINDPDSSASADAESLAAALTDPDAGSAVDAGESIDSGATPIGPDNDSGSAVDAGESLANALTDPDVGAGAEAGTLAAAAADADTGTQVDAEVLAAGLSDPDSGVAVDDGTAGVPLVDPDTGAVTDSGSIAAGVTDPDAASVADTEALGITLSDAELASTVEAALIGAGLSDAEVAAALDDQLISVLIPDFDTATADDVVASLAVALADADLGLAVDAVLALAAALADGDLGLADEVAAIAAALSDADFAVAVDAGVVLVLGIDIPGGVTVGVGRSGGVTVIVTGGPGVDVGDRAPGGSTAVHGGAGVTIERPGSAGGTSGVS